MTTFPLRARVPLGDAMADVTLTGELDDTAVSVFTGGHCGPLAIALHEATGWDLVGIGPVGEALRADNGSVCHAAVAPPNGVHGEIVDIRGRRVLSQDEWAVFDQMLVWTQADVRPVTREVLEQLQSEFHRDVTLPSEIIDHYCRRILDDITPAPLQPL